MLPNKAVAKVQAEKTLLIMTSAPAFSRLFICRKARSRASNHTSCTLVSAGYRKIGGSLYVGLMRPQLRDRAMADEHALSLAAENAQADWLFCRLLLRGSRVMTLEYLIRHPIKQFSLKALLRKPNAPASSTRSGHRSRSPLAFI